VIRYALPNSLWCLSATPRARRFQKALLQPKEAQEALLHRILRRNEGTEFGREHGFAKISSLEVYRDRVPVREYEAFLPWIGRIREGRPEILTADPVLRFVPTGGSSGGRKLIPWTASLGREFQRALAPWIVDLFRSRPELKGGPAYWSVSPTGGGTAEEEDSAVPVGFDGDSRYAGRLAGALVRRVLAVPESVAGAPDAETALRLTAVSLLRCRELRLISVWHPSFLLLLLERMEEEWDDLLTKVGESGSSTDRERARELGRAGPEDAGRIWPRLGLLSCWTDAGAAPSLPALRARFPRIPIQEKGLLATEAFSSMPYRGRRPLAIRSHVFEFLDPDGRAHLAHRVRKGETYNLVVTTSGGLYRYLTHDQVQVTGKLGATPTLRFVGRGDRTGDLRGEKLTDAFVEEAFRQLRAEGPEVGFAMLAPYGEEGQDPEEGAGGASTGYTLFLEAPSAAGPALSRRLDTLLSGNPQYRYARAMGQLRAPAVFLIREGGARTYLTALAQTGRPLGGIKPAALDLRRDWHRRFRGGYLVDPRGPGEGEPST